jgi:hypothetical protein
MSLGFGSRLIPVEASLACAPDVEPVFLSALKKQFCSKRNRTMGKTEEVGICKSERFGGATRIVNERIHRRVVRMIESIQEVGMKL